MLFHEIVYCQKKKDSRETMHQRVERHIVKPSFVYKDLCLKSKNLYNLANYQVRQEFIKTSKEVAAGTLKNATYLGYMETNRLLKNSDAYRALPAQTSQQTLRLLDKNWESFFKAVKKWRKRPESFTGRPKLPQYLDVKKGEQVVIFTKQQIRMNKGKIKFPVKAGIEPLRTKIECSQLNQVRVIPKGTHFVIEVVYTKEVESAAACSNKVLGIDLGVNNFATALDSQTGMSFIISGKGIKSLNQHFNKCRAEMQSKGEGKQQQGLSFRRDKKLNDFMHKVSRYIVEYCVENKIGKVVVGYNLGWKQETKLGRVNNQKFVSIPHQQFINQLRYKTEEIGIELIVQEESYTSKTDHLAFEEMSKKPRYLGRRIKRGLFKSSRGRIINADVNGCIGILRKVVGDQWLHSLLDSGCAFQPFRVYVSNGF